MEGQQGECSNDLIVISNPIITTLLFGILWKVSHVTIFFNEYFSKYSSTFSKYSSTFSKYSSTFSKYSSACSKYSSTFSKYSSTCSKYSSTFSKYSSTFSKYSSTFSKYSSTCSKYSSTCSCLILGSGFTHCLKKFSILITVSLNIQPREFPACYLYFCACHVITTSSLRI